METEKLKEQARKNAFRSNNGAVIRAVNIIRTDYVQLDMVLAALTPKIGKAEIMDGINYLTEAEYIRLRVIGTDRQSTLADSDFSELEAKLTAKGIRLVNGAEARESRQASSKLTGSGGYDDPEPRRIHLPRYCGLYPGQRLRGFPFVGGTVRGGAERKA